MPLMCWIKVVPRAQKQKCALQNDGKIKVWLKSPPEQGRANEELCQMVCGALEIERNFVSVVSGMKSRLKLVKIERDITMQELLRVLGIELEFQGKITDEKPCKG